MLPWPAGQASLIPKPHPSVSSSDQLARGLFREAHPSLAPAVHPGLRPGCRPDPWGSSPSRLHFSCFLTTPLAPMLQCGNFYSSVEESWWSKASSAPPPAIPEAQAARGGVHPLASPPPAPARAPSPQPPALRRWCQAAARMTASLSPPTGTCRQAACPCLVIGDSLGTLGAEAGAPTRYVSGRHGHPRFKSLRSLPPRVRHRL